MFVFISFRLTVPDHVYYTDNTCPIVGITLNFITMTVAEMSEQLDNYVYYVVLVRQFLLLNWCGFFIWYRFPNSMSMTWLFCIVFLLIREYFTHLGTSSLSVYGCSIKNYARQFIMVFEQGGIFIVPYLFWHGTSVTTVSSEVSPCLLAYYIKT